MNKMHIRKIAVLFVKYYSSVCLFWIFLTMLSSIIDVKFNTKFYEFFIFVSPVVSFPVLVNIGMLFISLFFEMCLWNTILYIPLILISLYPQLYKLDIIISDFAYKSIMLIIPFSLASIKLRINGKRAKDINKKKLKTSNKKTRFRSVWQYKWRASWKTNTSIQINHRGRERY